MSEYWATKATLKFAVFLSVITGVLMGIIGKSVGNGIVVTLSTLFFIAIFCKGRYDEKRRTQGIPPVAYSTVAVIERMKEIGGEKKK